MNDKYLKIVFSFLLLIFSLSAYSQKECAGQINLYNDKGEKNGFWREQNNYRITELYYQNGIEDGLCRIYNIKGKLQYMGYYKKGEMSDIWYDFGDYGHLLSICKDFADNTIRISYNGGQTWWLHKYKCYYRSYYPNGNIEKYGPYASSRRITVSPPIRRILFWESRMTASTPALNGIVSVCTFAHRWSILPPVAPRI